MATPDAFQFIMGLVSGLGGGLLSGLFGVGGGLILIPLLALALHLDQHRAQGITLAAMLLPNGLPAVLHYHRRGVAIPWGLVGRMMLGFLPSVWVGARLANRLPEAPLRWSFAAFLALLAAATLLQKPEPAGGVKPPDLARQTRWLPGLLIGASGGLAAGLLGIGGGVVVIPLLVLWLGLPQHEAQLVSLVLMLPPIGLPGVWVYIQAQKGLPWMILWGVAAGFLLGAYLGARLATGLGGPRLQRVFALLLVLMAGLMLLHRPSPRNGRDRAILPAGDSLAPGYPSSPLHWRTLA